MANVRVSSWCTIRRGNSLSFTVRMCSFWMSSMVPMVRLFSTLMASESGNAAELNGHMWLTSLKFTLLYSTFLLDE